MIRYGLSGCGYFGTAIGRLINSLPNASLVCVTSPGQTSVEFAQAMGVARYADFDAFLAHPNMDVVIIAGPNNTHTEQFTKAAQAGKQIYIEKPFALDLASAQQMIATARQSGSTFMVGHILHFYPRVAETLALLNGTHQAGNPGRVLSIHVERTGWEEAKPQLSWKKQKATSGGHLFHHIHEIDLVQYFAGPVRQVFCFADNLAHQGASFGDEDDVLLLTLKHTNGACSTMHYGSAFHFPQHFIRLNCQNGGILLDFQNNLFTIKIGQSEHSESFFTKEENASVDLYRARGGGAGYGRPGDAIPQYLFNALASELQCFHHVLETNIIPLPFADLFDGSSALASVAIASLAMQSASCDAALYLQEKP